MPGKPRNPNTEAACRAYASGLGMDTVMKDFQIGYSTLRRGLVQRGIHIRPAKRGNGTTPKNDYVAGAIRKPCIRCREALAAIANAGYCGPCGLTPICTCPPGLQDPSTKLRDQTICGRCRLVIYPFRPARKASA